IGGLGMTSDIGAQGSAQPVNVARGVGLLLAATLIFGVQEVVSKILVASYSPFQIVMVRYWAFFALAVWRVVRNSSLKRAFVSRAVGWQVARDLLLVLDMWLFAEELKTVPLGDIGAINIVYPLMVTVFAIPMLRERVSVFRMSSV